MNVSQNYQTVLNQLTLLSQKQGYLKYSDIDKVLEKYEIPIHEFDTLLNALSDRGILLYEKDPRNFDEKSIDEFKDFAQVDYDEVYRNALIIDPRFSVVVNYLNDIIPLQHGEVTALVAHAVEGNEVARQRLFDTHLRAVVRIALNYHDKFNLEFSDAFQLGCIGLQKAILHYDINENFVFGSYVSTYILSTIQRNKSYSSLIRFPVHFSDALLKFEKDYKISFFELNYNNDDILLLSNGLNISNDLAITIFNEVNFINIDSSEALQFVDREADVYDKVQKNNKLIDKLFEKYRESIKDPAKAERDIRVICARFGLYPFARSYTLQEVGEIFNVTRERIRQIESKTMRKLKIIYRTKLDF